MLRKLILLTFVSLLLVPAAALADGPINLALVPSIQIVGETESVTAIRLSIRMLNPTYE